MLKRNLESIEKDLLKYKEYNRESLLKLFIDEKLKWALKIYNAEVERNSNYLLSKNGIRVLKALTKLQKKQDKAVQELEKVPKSYFKKMTDTDFYEVRIEIVEIFTDFWDFSITGIS